MSDDPRYALDEADRCFAELKRILNAAIDNAAFSDPSDRKRLTVAKAALERGAAVLEELRTMLPQARERGAARD